jgi:Domain of unknown function (DUF397)
MNTDETPVTWHKSSYSQGGDCVEVSCNSTRIFVRDSKDSYGHALEFRASEWTAFTGHIKSGCADGTLIGDHELSLG